MRPSKSASEPLENTLRNGNSKQHRNKAQSRKKRVDECQQQRDARRSDPYDVCPNTFINHIAPSPPTKTNFDVETIPIASTGFIVLPDRDEGEVLGADKLVRDRGFRYIPWDGQTAIPITDSKGHIVAAMVGIPKDNDWDSVHWGLYDALRSSRSHCKFPKKAKSHRRGDFPALSVGISHGGGQKKPGHLSHSIANTRQMKHLLRNCNIRRIAGFSSGAFATWAPKLYMYYEENLEKLLKHDPSLTRNFPNSIWTTAAFNLGLRTVTCRHRDFANLPFGWCSIMSLGNFDPKCGGHLVLWSLKLVIEFPPGSTILLPSAVIPHSNTPIFRGEERASFTQYTAGGPFRWVDQGCRPKGEFVAGFTEEQWEEELRRMEERCQLGLSLFSAAESLPANQTLLNSRL